MWDFMIFGFTVYELFWFFVLYSILGWCTEVVFCTVTTGKWVNRGFLNGPVCPIYGFGMVIVLCALTPLANRLLVLFLGGMLLTSLLELVTGWVLEKIFHTHWWDYSDVPFNLGGYICPKFSLAWGLGSVFALRAVHPLVESLVRAVPAGAGRVLAWPVLAVFLADFIVTAASLAKLSRDLGRLDEMAAALRRQTDLLSQNIGGTALDVSARFEDAREDFSQTKAELSQKLEDARDDFSQAKAELSQKLEDARGDLTHKLEDARADLAETKGELAERFEDARGELAEKLDAAKEGFAEKLNAAHLQSELQAAYDAFFQKHRAARRLSRAYPALRKGRHELSEKLASRAGRR